MAGPRVGAELTAEQSLTLATLRSVERDPRGKNLISTRKKPFRVPHSKKNKHFCVQLVRAHHGRVVQGRAVHARAQNHILSLPSAVVFPSCFGLFLQCFPLFLPSLGSSRGALVMPEGHRPPQNDKFRVWVHLANLSCQLKTQSVNAHTAYGTAASTHYASSTSETSHVQHAPPAR